MPKALLHLARATKVSVAWVVHLFRSELAARIEAVTAVVVVGWLLVLRRSLGELVFLVILFCVLMSIKLSIQRARRSSITSRQSGPKSPGS